MSGLRERQKAGRRRSILLAARRLFLEHGYEATTIEAIAEAAGVSAVTIYNHYGTKGGVLLAVVGQSDGLLIEKIRALLANPPDDLLGAVLAFSKTVSDHAFSYLNKAIWRHAIATSVIEGSSEFGRGYAELDAVLVRLLADLLQSFKAKRDLPDGFDADVAAPVLYNIHNARFIQFMSDDSVALTELNKLVETDMAFALQRVAGVVRKRSARERQRAHTAGR